MAKPKKPYRSFPLTPHVRGGWAKKYKGHLLYLPTHDAKEALADFHRRAKAIDDGRVVRRMAPPSRVTVYGVVNRYVLEREDDVAAGTLEQRTLDDYAKIGLVLIDFLGSDTRVGDLEPDDFSKLFRELQQRLGSHALARAVQTVRTIFKHAEENDWITRRPRYGSIFKKPTTGKKTGTPITAEEARILIACATPNVQLEAMLLLMCNGGYLASDCAKLPVAAVDFAANIIRFPRPKMARRQPVDRAMVMWPETAEALREIIREDDDLVFRTMHGNPWVNEGTDSVRMLFQRIIRELGWTMRGPSWLRHLHRTLADELEKPSAAARLMGHRLPGMAETYVDRVEHNRIQEITDHVRLRIWPSSSGASPSRPASPIRAA